MLIFIITLNFSITTKYMTVDPSSKNIKPIPLSSPAYKL